MEAVERVKKEILMLIEAIQKYKTIIDLTDTDEQTKQNVLKEYDITLKTLNNTMKVKYLLAGGSLTDFNKLLESLDVKAPTEPAAAQEDNKEVKDIQDVKTIDINDIYKYNLEMIKRMSFDEFKFNIVLYTDATKLREEIVKTITAEKIDMRIIEYYYDKIELLNQNRFIIRDDEQRYSMADKLMRLKLTLDTVKDLEALRMCLKIYN